MSQPTDEQILTAIREELAAIKVPGAEDATPASTWKQLDVDSLDLVELVKALEDRYGISIDDDELKPVQSVGDAVALVQRLSPEAATA
jgi:acyl carrier protein